MTILLIYHGADLVTRRTFAALRSKGYDVYLATPDSTDNEGIPTVEIAAIRSKLTRRAIATIHRAIVDLGIDAVFCASSSALSNSLMANIGTKAKVIGYRGTQAKVRRFDPTYYLALLNPRVDHVVCETTDIADYLAGYLPRHKLSCHPKPYDISWVEDATAHPVRQDKSSGVLALSYVGVSEGRPHKGLHVLIEAVKILNSRGTGVHLTVVGKASEADIDSAPDNVTFTGNRPDAVRYIAGSDVFVLPSLRDASPRVVREAQACGVPCIVTDIPGARDLILTGSNGSGLLVPPDDAVAIADAVERLKVDTQLREKMSANALRNIRENYNFDDYVDYFDKVLNTCIHR